MLLAESDSGRRDVMEVAASLEFRLVPLLPMEYPEALSVGLLPLLPPDVDLGALASLLLGRSDAGDVSELLPLLSMETTEPVAAEGM